MPRYFSFEGRVSSLCPRSVKNPTHEWSRAHSQDAVHLPSGTGSGAGSNPCCKPVLRYVSGSQKPVSSPWVARMNTL